MKKTGLTLLVALCGLLAFGQQDALFSQYMFNKLVINPAYTGSRDVLSATLVNRMQWVGIDGAPNTATFSAHTPLRKGKVALGGYMYSDRIGPVHDFGVLGNYAYRIFMDDWRLAFGLQVGIKKMDIFYDEFNVNDNWDKFYDDQLQSKIQPDANFGIYLNNEHFYAGFSSRHLLESAIGGYDRAGNKVFQDLSRHFYLMSGGVFNVSDNIMFRPSTLIKFTPSAPVNIDLNASCLFHNTLWLGASYRSSKNALVFIVECNISRNLRIGYSYDADMNELKGQSRGSHEVLIGYDINLFNPRVLSPRYF